MFDYCDLCLISMTFSGLARSTLFMNRMKWIWILSCETTHEMNTLGGGLFMKWILSNPIYSFSWIYSWIILNWRKWWSSIKEMSKSLGEWQSRPDHYSPNLIHTILTPLAPFPDQLVPGSHSQQKPTELEAHLIIAFYSMHRMNVTLLSYSLYKERSVAETVWPIYAASPESNSPNTYR